MNPPSVLHGAMSRDRKPFTYTPGGLDLSEIKSQRMAERLMRNAMNPGVPEVALNQSLPSSMPAVPVALPNFNCLPVQVFPALPVNPKTLLRSRSNPDPRHAPAQRANPSTFVNNTKLDNKNTIYENKQTYPQQLRNNRPISMYEYHSQPANTFVESDQNFGGDGYTQPSITNTNIHKPVSENKQVVAPKLTKTSLLPEISYEAEFLYMPKIANKLGMGQTDTTSIQDEISTSANLQNNRNLIVDPLEKKFANPQLDGTVNSKKEEILTPTLLAIKTDDEYTDINDKQREVKIVKKQVTKEKKTEEQNGKQNGDANEETEMTVRLPAKKSEAKTETKVEVEKKILPDGSIEEIKTTTTKTTIDGRTEIKTRTETKTIPKAVEYEEEVEEEEEEDEVGEEEEERKEEIQERKEIEEKQEKVIEELETVSKPTVDTPKQNGVLKTQEKSETTIAKKVVIIQESEPEEVEEVEEEEIEESEVEEAEPVTIVLKKQATPEKEVKSEEVTEEVKVLEVEKHIETAHEEEVKTIENKKVIGQGKETVEEEENEIEEEMDEKESHKEIEEEKNKEGSSQNVEENKEKTPSLQDNEDEQDEEEEYVASEDEKQENEEKIEEKPTKIENDQLNEEAKNQDGVTQEDIVSDKCDKKSEESTEMEEHVIPVHVSKLEGSKPVEKSSEFKIPMREPSIPLDKVEDVDIKPIGMTPIITKSHTEDTEIVTSNVDPSGGLSRQTEYNKIENIVTVNRTTKILDQNYENLTQQGIPTVKTYFPPPTIDRISTSPMLSRPYQPYAPEQTTERRHSLLLERLSMERQMPSDLYQYSNQLNDQVQYQDEPQSEVLTVSNVKPSSITNQQWYQQTNQTQNVLYNNVTSNPTHVGAPWAQPKSPQPQPYQTKAQYQPPSQSQYQTQHQTSSQSQFQQDTTPQPQYQRGTTPQPQYQKTTAPQPQYQPSYSEPNRDRISTKNYSTYTPTPSWLGNTVDPVSNQYSYIKKDTTQSYQKNTYNSTSQQFSSGYVPPPWEQDSSYTSVNNTSEKYYQEIPQSNTFTPTPSQGWEASTLPAKFTKPAPIAYVPPAPNQSFVKTGSQLEPPRQPGRKTYYSEYERRYITVPESTYIPTETKFQPQPDPSPQYYYDNNEPKESVEPQWRRELREFTEKTSQTTEPTSVQPPWEVESKYSKTPSSTYTPTPTWSQTLRPQSYRKRSFESEFVSQEWPKTNTLGRGRPLSTIGKSLDGVIPERVRGVSVDRYNPNSYQPPAEHPPVQSHTLTTPLPHASYHNPNVPAYHTRASVEPREQPTYYQQRVYRENRASPLQSRSFKYLQWITGTEN